MSYAEFFSPITVFNHLRPNIRVYFKITHAKDQISLDKANNLDINYN